MHRKYLALVAVAGILSAAAKVMLIDDISGEERHGGISIDSTRNGMNHIVQKIRNLKTPGYYPVPGNRIYHSSVHITRPPIYERQRTSARITYNIPSSQRLRPAQRPYSPPYHTIYNRIETLLHKIQQAQKANNQKEIRVLEMRGKKESLQGVVESIEKSKRSVDSALALTKKELEAMQIDLETIKEKIKDLTDQSEYLSEKKYKTQAKLKQLQEYIGTSEYHPEDGRRYLDALKEQYEEIKSKYIEEIENSEFVYGPREFGKLEPNKYI